MGKPPLVICFKLAGSGEAAGDKTPGLGARAFPILKFGRGPGPAIGVGEAVLPDEDRGIAQTAILVALQIDALPARQFRHLGERKKQ